MPEKTATREELTKSLARLHAELVAAPRLDQATRRLLKEVLTDIERALQEPRHRSAPAAERATGDSAPRRLESLAVEFQAQHPVLAASIQQFVDLLGRAGL